MSVFPFLTWFSQYTWKLAADLNDNKPWTNEVWSAPSLDKILNVRAGRTGSTLWVWGLKLSCPAVCTGKTTSRSADTLHASLVYRMPALGNVQSCICACTCSMGLTFSDKVRVLCLECVACSADLQLARLRANTTTSPSIRMAGCWIVALECIFQGNR